MKCRKILIKCICMGEIFMIIPEFKILLNSAGNNSVSDLVSIYLKVFDH